MRVMVKRLRGLHMHSTSHVLREFLRKEDGLVTVEWVALASALVIGAIAIGWMVMDALKTPAGVIGTNITTNAPVDPGE
jgi:hypothetical protein